MFNRTNASEFSAPHIGEECLRLPSIFVIFCIYFWEWQFLTLLRNFSAIFHFVFATFNYSGHFSSSFCCDHNERGYSFCHWIYLIVEDKYFSPEELATIIWKGKLRLISWTLWAAIQSTRFSVGSLGATRFWPSRSDCNVIIAWLNGEICACCVQLTLGETCPIHIGYSTIFGLGVYGGHCPSWWRVIGNVEPSISFT